MKFPSSMKSVLLACAASVALAGCQGTEDSARQEIASVTMQGNIAKQAFKEQHDNAGPDNVRYRQGVWLGSEATRSSNGMPLPDVVESNDAVTISSPNPMSIVELARRITMITGIEVSGTTELSDSDQNSPKNIAAIIDYKGPLSGLLDMAAAKYGISWEYRGTSIQVFQYQTRTFMLDAQNLTHDFKNDLKSTINGGDGSGGSSGSSSGSGGTSSSSASSDNEGGVKTSKKIDYWGRVEKQIDNLVPEGTKWSVSPDSGALTVTSTPEVLNRVEQWVKTQNQIMTRQIAVSVKVLSISESESEGISTDLDAIFSDASSGIGATFNALGPGVGTATTSVLGTLSKGKFSGSQLLIQALETKSHGSIVTSGSGITMNNVPLPIQNSKETGYIKSVDTSNTQTATSNGVTPGTITTGFSMTVLPRIRPDNKVILTYNVGISTLDDLKDLAEGDNTVQVPETTSRGFQQTVMLRSGDTLVLGGFQKADNNVTNTKSGILSWLVGGDRTSSKDQELIVILITPVIIEDPSEIAKMK